MRVHGGPYAAHSIVMGSIRSSVRPQWCVRVLVALAFIDQGWTPPSTSIKYSQSAAAFSKSDFFLEPWWSPSTYGWGFALTWGTWYSENCIRANLKTTPFFSPMRFLSLNDSFIKWVPWNFSLWMRFLSLNDILATDIYCSFYKPP